MVSQETFYDIMRSYGTQIWPAQIIFYLIAILLVLWILFKPGRLPDLFSKLYLSTAFLWNGILFYLTLAKDMAGSSHSNIILGALFILVAILFAVDVFRHKMRFILPTITWQKHLTLSLFVLTFCYPVFGYLSGHELASLIVPGTYPCPTTAFALLLLTMALPRVDWLIYILLLFFSIPFTPFFQIARYGVFEDAILFTTGIYSLVLLIKSRKVKEIPSDEAPAG